MTMHRELDNSFVLLKAHGAPIWPRKISSFKQVLQFLLWWLPKRPPPPKKKLLEELLPSKWHLQGPVRKSITKTLDSKGPFRVLRPNNLIIALRCYLHDIASIFFFPIIR